MSKSTDILFDLIDLYMQKNEIYSMQGTVKSVNESERTCVVTPANGSPDILDVRLEADYTEDTNTDPKGFFVVPKVGSIVCITFLSKDEAFVSVWTEIDKLIYKGSQCSFESDEIGFNSDSIVFNEGLNGGLTNTPEIRTQLDKNNELIQALIDIISGAPIPEPGNGANSALQTALAAAIVDKELGSFEAIEDTKVKH